MVNSKIKKKLMSIYLGFVLISFGFIGLLAFEDLMDEGSVKAATVRYVGGSGPGNYSKIQDAIDNASTGDIIRVYAGTYYENVIVNKTVTLIGNGTGNTMIDVKGGNDVVYITSNWVNITNFTITNSGAVWGYVGIELNDVKYCRIENNDCSNIDNGTGIVLDYSSSNTLMNNTCSNNRMGILLEFSSNNTFINNTSSSNKEYGIALSYSSHNNKFLNNTIESNSHNGISIKPSGGEKNKIKSNIIQYNCKDQSTNYHAIQIETKYNEIIGNIITNNKGIGVYLKSVSGNIISNNTCSNNDDGIGLEDSSGNTLMNNTCDSNNAEGIFLSSSSPNTLMNNTCSNNRMGILLEVSSNNVIINNTCPSNLNGIYLESESSNILIDNTCYSNTNSGIYLKSSSYNNFINNTCNSNNKYGIFLESSSSNNIIENCLISSNSVNNFYVSDNSKNNSAINTTFNTIYVDSTSSLIVKNYLHIQVNGSTGAPLPNAHIQVKDNNTIIYATSGYSGTDQKTNSEGQIKWILVTDRIYNCNRIATENTTTVNVKYPGLTFKYNNRDVNMFTSHFEYFDPNYLPTKVILKSPADNSFISDFKPKLEWDKSTNLDGDPLTYFIEVDEYGEDWTTLVDSYQTSTGVLSWDVTTNLIENQSYQWRVCAHDNHNSGPWSNVWKFTIDTLAPSAPIGVTVTPAGWTNINSFNISWTNPDDTSGIVTGVFYKLNSPPTSDTDGNWVDTKPITELFVPTEGTHTIYIWLKDKLDHINYLNYSTIKLYYDITPPSAPVISSSTHPKDTWVNNNDLVFTWSAPAEISGIFGYSYILDQNTTTTPDTISEGTSTNASFTNKADGVWYFHARAVDLAGNWGPAEHYKIKIDVTAPSPANANIIIDSGSEYSNDLALNLEWDNFKDFDRSDIAGYYYSFINNEGTSNGTWTTSPEGFLTATQEGESTIYVWAQDDAGNIGPAASALIIIKLPIVADLELSANTIYRTQTITFTSNCNDPCDPENKLDCKFQYKHENGNWQNLTPTYKSDQGGYSQAEFTPTNSAELGVYFVRVKYTNLNDTSTDWTMKPFTVQNYQPKGHGKIDWTTWVILIIVIIIILIIILIVHISKKFREQELESISEIEEQLEKARELGLPTGELEKLLKDAKQVREIKDKEPVDKKVEAKTKKINK